MGLDIYVMPLWRFWTGDFTSPMVELLGEGMRVVRPGGGELDDSKNAARTRESGLKAILARAHGEFARGVQNTGPPIRPSPPETHVDLVDERARQAWILKATQTST